MIRADVVRRDQRARREATRVSGASLDRERLRDD
jgi:hypothetical protein